MSRSRASTVDGRLNGADVTGTAWMDHEWFTQQLDPSQRGWDWFSVQLDNGTELMLFELRRTDGTIDPYSSGTYIAKDGRATHLKRGDFELQPLEYWTSPKTGAQYPVKWRISVPSLGIALECTAAVRATGIGVRRRRRPHLLGRRGHVLRLVAGRRLSGDDRIRQPGEAVARSIRPDLKPRATL